MMMPGRKYEATSSYRYGFNGKENDNEVKGEGNQQNYGMRIYDPRIGKFLSVDPLTKSYPMLTPYQYASNDPIESIDVDGLERNDYRLTFPNGNAKLDLISIGEKKFTHGGAFGLFSSTDNIPKYYRVEYNGQHYLFASGGQNSDYAKSLKPLPTSSGHLDNIYSNVVYSVAELWSFQSNPSTFVQTHTSTEARLNESIKKGIEQGFSNYLSNAPANITEGYGYYSFCRTTSSVATDESATSINGGNTQAAQANNAAKPTISYENQTIEVNANVPYKRPNNATTPAQRAAVNQPGAVCATCGTTQGPFVADHKTPLAIEHISTGTIDKENMRSLEAVQSQCEGCSIDQSIKVRKASQQANQIIKNKQNGNSGG